MLSKGRNKLKLKYILITRYVILRCCFSVASEQSGNWHTKKYIKANDIYVHPSIWKLTHSDQNSSRWWPHTQIRPGHTMQGSCAKLHAVTASRFLNVGLGAFISLHILIIPSIFCLFRFQFTAVQSRTQYSSISQPQDFDSLIKFMFTWLHFI